MSMSLYAPHLVLSGSFSTGKSTVFQEIVNKFGKQVYAIPDGGEAVIKTFGKPIGAFTPEENHQAQRGVYEHYRQYLAAGQQAYHMGLADLVLSDASFLENLVYSRSFVTVEELTQVYQALEAIADHTHFVHFPVGETALTDNNIRHVDLSYQEDVDMALRNLQREYGLRVTEITELDINARVQTVSDIIMQMLATRYQLVVL